MTSPFADDPPPAEARAGVPVRAVRIQPNAFRGENFVHLLDHVDRTASLDELVDRYALPAADSYLIELLTVPEGTPVRLGQVSQRSDRSGGGQLTRLGRMDVPTRWIDARTTLEAFLK